MHYPSDSRLTTVAQGGLLRLCSAKRESERSLASTAVELETLKRRLADADEERTTLAKALSDAKEVAQVGVGVGVGARPAGGGGAPPPPLPPSLLPRA